MKAHALTVVVAILLVVLPELLTQTDVLLSPTSTLLVRLGILAVGVVARYLPTETPA